jgi:hypothetical protein
MTKMSGRWAVVLSVVILVSPERRAHGEERDPVTAEALFRQGREAIAKGDFAAACPKFVESQRLDPSVGTLMNVAECEEHEGRVASAWERWHEAMDQLLHASDDRVATARAHLAALEPRLPKLVVRLPPDLPEGQVTRDGVRLGPAAIGVAVPVDPGEHRLTLSVPGHETRDRAVRLVEGQTLEVSLTAGAPAAEPSAATRSTEPTSTRRTLGWSALGLAGAGLATALVSGALAAHDRSVVDAECDASRACSQRGLDAARAGRTWLVVNATSVVLALVATGIGVLLLVTGDGRTVRE